MLPVIELLKVCKSFGGTRVFDEADLEILKGETLTVIGGSGKGKSVFLKLLLGVLKPDAGKVLFLGRNLSTMNDAELSKYRSRIGMLFQNAALFDSLTVAENVAYPVREHFKYSENEIAHIVTEKLAMVGLAGIEDMMPSELSGGMKKRVGLARAIATNPDVILYDEPTTGLDPTNTKRICTLIKKLQDKLGVTSVVVTHDMEAAFFVTDRIAMIHHHRFGFIGTKEDAEKSINPLVKSFIRGELETGDG